jgi:hypothetical protein
MLKEENSHTGVNDMTHPCHEEFFNVPMDASQVLDRHDTEKADDVSPESRWLFMPDDDSAPDLFFPTEQEACSAQQGWRIARGFNPFSGLRKAIQPGPGGKGED